VLLWLLVVAIQLLRSDHRVTSGAPS
jgi:hypothetical protein